MTRYSDSLHRAKELSLWELSHVRVQVTQKVADFVVYARDAAISALTNHSIAFVNPQFSIAEESKAELRPVEKRICRPLKASTGRGPL